MTIESLHLVRRLALSALEDALGTLEEILDRPRGLEILCVRMGWRLEGFVGADPVPLLTSLRTVRQTIDSAVLASSDTESATAGQEMIAAVERLEDEWTAFGNEWRAGLDDSTPGALEEEIATAFLLDLQEYLLLEWFLRRVPSLLRLAEALGVLRWERATPIETPGTDPERVRYPVVRRTLPLLRVITLAANPMAPLEKDGVGDALEAVGEEMQRLLDGIAGRFEDISTGDTRIRLRPDAIELVDFDPPLLRPGTPPATIGVPLLGDPAAQLSFTLAPDRVRFSWIELDPTPGAAFALFEADGFRVLAGGPSGADDSVPALTLALADPPELMLSGALGVELPVSWVSDEVGGSLQLRAGGRLGLAMGGSLDVFIDYVSGEFANLRLAGSGGPTVETALLRLRDLHFPMETPPRLEVEGAVALGDTRIQMAASLDTDAFAFQSTATVELPGGLRFEPIGEAPVLSFHLPLSGSGTLQASFAGAIKIPGYGGLESVELSGQLDLSLDTDGFAIESAAITAAIAGSWVLPGGIEVQEASIALAYEADLFAIRLGGKIGVGSGTIELERAELAYSDDDVRLDVTQSVTDISLDDLARLRTGTVHLAVVASYDGSELSGSLAIEDGSADFVQSGSDWLVTIDDLAAAMAVDDGLEIVVQSGTISFAKPFAADPSERVSVSIDHFAFHARPGSLSLVGAWHLATPLDLWENAGFRLAVDAGSGFGLALGDDTATRITVQGGVRFYVSEEALQSIDSVEQVSVGISGATKLVLGPDPSIEFDDVGVTLGPGTFRLGGNDAMTLSNAMIELKGLERIGRSTAADPFEVRLSGRLQIGDDGPALSLTDSAFVFVGHALPVFQPGGVGIETGSFGDDLPFRVTEAWFELIDSTIQFPASLHYTNMILGMSVELELPIGGDGAAGFMARADDIVVDLSTDVPTVTLDGVGMGVDTLQLGPIEVSGLLYVGGLGALTSLPAQMTGDLPPGVRPFFVAGKVGGRYNGTKLNVLLAMRPDRPLGACIDVAIDGGIPLWYGFTLNGASGGVSFSNQANDPCDIKSYISFPDDPSQPPAVDDTGWQGESEEYAFEGGRAVTPESGCDCNCPPPSMNPLCQPHPDGANYPGRAILKFSAIQEETLEQWGVLALVDGIGSNVQAGVESILDELRVQLEPLVPAVPVNFELPDALPDQLAEMARDPVGAIVAELRPRLILALQGAGSAMREKFIRTMEAGVECPDVTVQVTGTFSYTGVGYFLTVTGGVNIGTTGAGGIIGSVNIFGIPIGRLRAFASGTDDQGLPRFALCGDLDVSFGPFDFGRLCVTTTAPSYERICLEALVEHLPALAAIAGTDGPALLDELLDGIDPTPGAVADRIAALDVEGAMDIVNRLSARSFESLPALRDWSGALFTSMWEGFDPTLDACGVVQPKIFGIPLIGEVASLSMTVRKDRLGASVTVPLSQALASVVAGSYASMLPPTDYLTVAVGCGFPDPVAVGIQTFLGIGRDPGAFVDAISDEVDRMLEETLYAVGLEVSPFGLELADAESRIVLPDLLNYPADSWAPPDGRPERLAECLEADLLVEPAWTGDLAAVGRPGEDLRRDWFPHGGLLGAGKLRLPRLLADEPPLDLIGRIVDNDDILDRIGALASFIGDYVTQVSEIGTLGFYLPAPSPPPGLTGSIQERLARLAEHAQVGGVRSDLFFASGEVSARLFGVELGRMSCRFEAPGPGQPGRFELEGEVGDAWLEALVGRVAVQVVITTPPPLPIQLYFGVAQRLVTLAAQNRLTPAQVSHALAEAAAAHVVDPDRRAEVHAELQAAFADVPTSGSSSDRISGLTTAIGDALADAFPKVGMSGDATGLDLPPPLAGLLTLDSARVVAYSPFFDPTAPEDDAFAQAKRYGGVGIEVLGAELDVAGWRAELDRFALSARGGPGGVPLVSGRALAKEIFLPGLDVDHASLSFANTDPLHARLEIVARELDMGWARLLPAAALDELIVDVDALAGSASFSPARLILGTVGVAHAQIDIHGEAEDDAFEFSPAGEWAARLDVSELRLEEPVTGTTWVAEDVAGARLEARGYSVRRLEGAISFEVGTVGPLSILGIEVFSSIEVDAAVRYHVELEGFETDISGRATGSFQWHGSQLSFDTGPFSVSPASEALLEVARAAVLTGFGSFFLSFDNFIDAIEGGWVVWQFDAANLVALLTRVYGIIEIGDVIAALARLPLSAAQSASVLNLLFRPIPHADLAPIDHVDASFGHVDGVQHSDAVLVPHVDHYVGLHGDGVLHGDVAAGHADVAPVHGDVAPTVHLDAAAQAHIDTAVTLHADSVTGHVDTAPGLHADVPGPVHVDGYVPPHGDVAGVHADIALEPHGDVSVQPHGDLAASAHVDSATPHIDAPAPPPHIDSSSHSDIPRTHVDVAGSHADARVHLDVAGVHADIRSARHADSPEHHRRRRGGRGHGDAPAIPHADRAAIPHVDGDEPPPWHVDAAPQPHGDTWTRHGDSGAPVSRPPGGGRPSPRIPGRSERRRRLPHVDVAGTHLDRSSEPHGDAPAPASPHLDVGPIPHGDQNRLRHADTGGTP